MSQSILMYNVRDDELPAIRRWSEENGIKVDTNRELLSLDTADYTKGYDGVLIQQSVRIGDPAVYASLRRNGLKQLSTRTAGYDMIDVREAARNGLTVTNVPAYSPNAIAELAVMQTMQLIRHMPALSRRISGRDFRWNGLVGREIRSLTVGIVGTGRIGLTTARLFAGMGARVIGYSRSRAQQSDYVHAWAGSLQELMAEADVVSLHLPLTEDNYYMINRESLSWMKPGSYLINTSRGGLVCTDDLLDAIADGTVAGAALDTIEDEAPYFNKDCSAGDIRNEQLARVLECPHILLTPHIGFYTDTAIDNIVVGGLNAVLEVLTTGSSENAVYTGPPPERKPLQTV